MVWGCCNPFYFSYTGTTHVFSVTSKCKSICVMWMLENHAIFFNSYYISFHPQDNMYTWNLDQGERWGETKAVIMHGIIAPTQYYGMQCIWYDCNSTVPWHFKQRQHVLCNWQPPTSLPILPFPTQSSSALQMSLFTKCCNSYVTNTLSRGGGDELSV